MLCIIGELNCFYWGGGDYGLPIAEINDIIDVVTVECYNHTNLYNIQQGLVLMLEIFERKVQNE